MVSRSDECDSSREESEECVVDDSEECVDDSDSSSEVVTKRKSLVFKNSSSPKVKKRIKKVQSPKENEQPLTCTTHNLHLDNLIKKFSLVGDSLKLFLIFYLSNRPSSSTELSLSLPKKALEAALGELLEKDLILQKTYNKTKIYMLNSFVCDYQAGEDVDTGKDTLRILQKKLSDIQTEPTEKELEEKIRLVKSRIEKNKEHLSRDLYTEEEVVRLSPKALLKVLKERRMTFKNIVDILTENLNMKKKEFLDEVGIE